MAALASAPRVGSAFCLDPCDTNDAITDCPAQLQVRALIDLLLANLST